MKSFDINGHLGQEFEYLHDSMCVCWGDFHLSLGSSLFGQVDVGGSGHSMTF